MRSFWCLLAGILILAGCSSDDEGGETPSTVPVITLNDVVFGPSTTGGPDTVSVRFSYQDNDGDLGLSASDDEAPFQSYFFFVATGGGNMTLLPSAQILDTAPSPGPPWVVIAPTAVTGKLVTNRTRQQAGYEQLVPPNEFPYSCKNYFAQSLYIPQEMGSLIDDSYNITDTLIIEGKTHYEVRATTDEKIYYQRNDDALNLKVDFLAEQADGSYDVFDWLEDENPDRVCSSPNFHGRFPRIDALPTGVHEAGPFTFNILSKSSGEITYHMVSSGFQYLFAPPRKFKLRVTVMDRALNKSNVIESEAFTLNDIRRGK